MLLAVDIGNSNIVFGVYDGKAWIHQWRINTSHDRMSDEYAVLFNQLFNEVDIHFKQFKKVIMSSVVPPLTTIFMSMLEKRIRAPLLLVDHRTETGLEICVNPSEELGSDIIVNSVAAYQLFNDNCLVVDFGTATSIMAIQKPGKILGGAVAAGLKTTANALSSKTSQLPQVALSEPLSVIGANTVTAMQSGLLLGHACMVEGMVARMKEELGGAKVVATGGLANTIHHMTDCFDKVDQWLTLDGLRLIAKRV